MSTQTAKQKKAFPVTVLLQHEAELVAKALEGFMLSRSEKAQIDKLLARLRKGQG